MIQKQKQKQKQHHQQQQQQQRLRHGLKRFSLLMTFAVVLVVVSIISVKPSNALERRRWRIFGVSDSKNYNNNNNNNDKDPRKLTTETEAGSLESSQFHEEPLVAIGRQDTSASTTSIQSAPTCIDHGATTIGVDATTATATATVTATTSTVGKGWRRFQNHRLHNNHNNNNNNNLLRRVGGGGGATATTAVVGVFSNVWKKIRCRTVDWNRIKIAVVNALDSADIIALITIGWFTEPIVRHYYKLRKTIAQQKRKQKQKQNTNNPKTTTKEDATDSIISTATIDSLYEDSWSYKVSIIVQELGRIGCIVYAFDIVSIVLRKIGFQLSTAVNQKIGQTMITFWTALRVRRLKQLWFHKIMLKHHSKHGRAAILSRVVDGCLGIIVLFFLHDIFQLTIGKGLQSIAAVGGLSTIVFSLAARDFAEMLLSGIAIYNSDKFDVGEIVRFGDGTIGTIVSQGAFELQIRGPDGIITRIPNGQITNQRVQNLSRTTTSTIKQTLQFRYEDIDTLPTVLQSIKDEIIISCPKLINDGSRSFSALWTDYQNDHLEAVVEASFTIPPTEREYHTNKQLMLQAISRAVKKHSIEFAIPTSLCLSEEKK